MNKPTHIGMIKNFNELFKLDRSLWPVVISAGYMKDLAELMGHEIKVDEKEDHLKENYYGTGDILIHRDWFQYLQEIKPQIEIPATPFWFKDSIGDLFSIDVNRGQLWDYILYKNDKHWKGVDRLNVETMLNDGTWKIVDEPKKEMRPWEYEEWREWFFTDRVVIDRINQEDNTDVVRTAYITVLGMTPEDEDQFYYMGEGEWLSKDHFLESFFDRHGNKFEKEV